MSAMLNMTSRKWDKIMLLDKKIQTFDRLWSSDFLGHNFMSKNA